MGCGVDRADLGWGNVSECLDFIENFDFIRMRQSLFTSLILGEVNEKCFWAFTLYKYNRNCGIDFVCVVRILDSS